MENRFSHDPATTPVPASDLMPQGINAAQHLSLAGEVTVALRMSRTRPRYTG